jgi:hypothetical protein
MPGKGSTMKSEFATPRRWSAMPGSLRRNPRAATLRREPRRGAMRPV